MNSGQFKKYGHEIIDWAINYMGTLHEIPTYTDKKPGYMRNVIPADAPDKAVTFDKIIDDLQAVVVDGMAHWQHRQFFAYFPAGNSWPSILGDIFSNGVGVNGYTWYTCPLATELETIVMDWCCKFLGLPEFFLSSYSNPESQGQGVLQCSASEAIFYSMVWARQDALKKLKQRFPNKPKAVLLNMLVAYCNNECHCCVERAALIGCIRIKKLKADHMGVIRSNTLRHAIEDDMSKGLVPFYHCAIIGSTGTTASDDLMEVGRICEKYELWLHCDAAYAGSSFVLPELSHLKQGFEYVWSTNINTNKWMLCNFEASLHWVRYKEKAIDAFAGGMNSVLKYPNGVGPDLKHYGVANTRRLRAFKLYSVIRAYGVEGIRRYIRRHIDLAKLFEMYVRRDHRFEVLGGPFKYGLVTFRLKGYNRLNKQLMDGLNNTHRIHLVSSHFHDQVVLRFALCAEHANERDVDIAWRKIDHMASKVLLAYEKRHREDLAMKILYRIQHRHDAEEEERNDPEEKAADAEAEAAFRNLDKSLATDHVLQGADDADLDGSYGMGDTTLFALYDKHLEADPKFKPTYDDSDEEGGETSAQPATSMLHLRTLNETIKHVPKS